MQDAPGLDVLESRLGHEFQRKDLLLAAVTHRSFVHEHPGESRAEVDNQRLEFLGDAVIQLVVSQELMSTCREAEGKLTKLRARIVDSPSLYQAALALELGSHLRLGKGEERSGGRTKRSLLADAFEALAGALFLDAGYDRAREILARHLAPLMSQASKEEPTDPKSRLQEYVQARFGQLPAYETVRETGPEHAKVFEVQVSLSGQVLGVGKGSTKKAAAKAAAAMAYEQLTREATRSDPSR